MRMARARCPHCDRIVAVNRPQGDSTWDVYRWHRKWPGGSLCPNSREPVGYDEYVENAQP